MKQKLIFGFFLVLIIGLMFVALWIAPISYAIQVAATGALAIIALLVATKPEWRDAVAAFLVEFGD